jgi:hypothetical protein
MGENEPLSVSSGEINSKTEEQQIRRQNALALLYKFWMALKPFVHLRVFTASS